MRTIQRWFCLETVIQKLIKSTEISLLVVPVLITGAIILAPLVPSPLGFWLALSAVLIGPGWNIPRFLFNDNKLTLPEDLFFVILSSIFIDTILFASLNYFGVKLYFSTISVVILIPTYFSTIPIVIKKSHILNKAKDNDEPSWGIFLAGIIFATLLAFSIYYFV